MNLIIEASLCEPPSEVTSFRDVTLYGKTRFFEDILVECKSGTRSLYWKWLKSHGAHDFVSALIRHHEKESGFRLSPRSGNLNIAKIDSFNLHFIISVFNTLRRRT